MRKRSNLAQYEDMKRIDENERYFKEIKVSGVRNREE